MFRLTYVFTGPAGTPYYSRQYFEGTTQADVDEAATRLEDFWQSFNTYIQSSMLGTLQGEAEVIDASTGLITNVLSAGTSVVTFAGGAANVPLATQGLIRLQTTLFLNGRRLQGRIFIPGLAQAANALGVPSAGFQANMASAGLALAGLGTLNSALVVYSETHRAFANVTSVTSWNKFAVMRSRRD